MNAFELKNVYYTYPNKEISVLNDLSLEIKKATVHGIIGNNDAGKTTLCTLLRGFIPHFYMGNLEGSVTVVDQNIRDLSLSLLSDKIGYVFQNPFTQISGAKDNVYEEIAFGLENLAVEPSLIKTKVDEVCATLNIKHLCDKNPNQLSGGQKQKVAIASIMAMDPDIYIFDEPTSQLDPQASLEVFEIIKNLKALGKTIVIIEHKIELMASITDFMTILDHGTNVLTSDTLSVLTSKKMDELNICKPQYITLFEMLKKQGVKFDKYPLTLEEATQELKNASLEGKCLI